MSYGGVVATGKNGCHLCWTHGMLQRQSHCRPGPAGGAAANRIHDHQHGAASRRQQAVHILRSSGLFYAESSEILAHGDKELFRVWHTPILPYEIRRPPDPRVMRLQWNPAV
jgi:hypothetical protein